MLDLGHTQQIWQRISLCFILEAKRFQYARLFLFVVMMIRFLFRQSLRMVIAIMILDCIARMVNC